ncbi:hypothetical protein B0H67DRAFT_588380 [Lasiosphaeris hirsuta]|uniref:Uncharacterized protein n=1 Tax=Lasiosphaeris hirsuta TaxID=260670 RepID=A0AA40DLL7_9PEZI|nr:hypothetical protein B0H67DRAFT_588380 [Lasiosphaeris hirsuta]
MVMITTTSLWTRVHDQTSSTMSAVQRRRSPCDCDDGLRSEMFCPEAAMDHPRTDDGWQRRLGCVFCSVTALSSGTGKQKDVAERSPTQLEYEAQPALPSRLTQLQPLESLPGGPVPQARLTARATRTPPRIRRRTFDKSSKSIVDPRLFSTKRSNPKPQTPPLIFDFLCPRC